MKITHKVRPTTVEMIAEYENEYERLSCVDYVEDTLGLVVDTSKIPATTRYLYWDMWEIDKTYEHPLYVGFWSELWRKLTRKPLYKTEVVREVVQFYFGEKPRLSLNPKYIKGYGHYYVPISPWREEG